MSNPTIGQRLRAARESMPASVYQASRDTKIRADFLELMERDNFRFISGPAYIRGLLRSYARYLGLPEDEITSEFDSTVALPAAPTVKQIFKEPAAAPKNRRPHWVLAAALAAGTLMVLSLVGLMKPAGPIVARPPSPDEVVTTTPEARSPSTSTVASAPIQIQGVQLVVTIIGSKCWLRVEADGRSEEPVFQGTMLEGDSQTFAASDHLKVTFGDLKAVKVMVNGRELPISADSGQVGTFVFHPDTTALTRG